MVVLASLFGPEVLVLLFGLLLFGAPVAIVFYLIQKNRNRKKDEVE